MRGSPNSLWEPRCRPFGRLTLGDALKLRLWAPMASGLIRGEMTRRPFPVSELCLPQHLRVLGLWGVCGIVGRCPRTPR